MASIRVLIVEDKALIAEDIAQALRTAGMTIVGTCGSGEEAIRLAAATSPDIIVMDIQLQGAVDGISAAHAIAEKQSVSIIYLTEFTDQHTLERAKHTYPANYLTKPFTPEQLVRAVDLAVSNANKWMSNRDHARKDLNLFVRTESQVYVKVPLNSIVYLKADRAYCLLVTDDNQFILSNSLRHYHAQLDQNFVRVHRSFVVNINRITGLDGNVIQLGKHEVQTTKEYRDELTRHVRILK